MNKFVFLFINIALVSVFASEEKTEKCGEGKDVGVHKCVLYYRCQPPAASVISTDTGVLDSDLRYKIFLNLFLLIL